MAYERINWQNEPSEATALNDVNLNKMDSAIYDHDQRLDTAESDIGDIESDVTTAQGDITDLQGDMTTAQGDITALQNGKVDKESGKGLSTISAIGVTTYTNQGGTICDFVAIDQSGSIYHNYIKNGVDIDSALSSMSQNPVENRVVKNAIDAKSKVSISDTLAEGDTIANITIDGTTTPIKAKQPNEEEMNVRSAMMLLTPPITNNAPYVKRVIGGGIPNPYLCKLKKLIGASVVWNQFVDTATTSVTIPSGHKYIHWNGSTLTKGTSDGTAISVIGGTDKISDLTFMFGSSVADGITVEQFAFLFPNYSETAYSANTMQSVSVSGKKNVGKNLFDKLANDTSKGFVDNSYLWSNGTTRTSNAWYISEYIRIYSVLSLSGLPTSDATNPAYGFYTEDKTFISGGAYNNRAKIENFTIPPNAYYFRISVPKSSVDIVQVETNTTATTYKPYHTTEYPIDHTTLRGLFKLDANNNIYADGDEYEPSGDKTEKCVEIDLGSATWTATSWGAYRTALPNDCAYTSSSNIANAIAEKYQMVSYQTLNQSRPNNCIALGYSSTPNIYVIADSTPSGKLVYPLSTPTTSTADGYTSLQNIESGGTEEFIDYGVEQGTRDMAIPCGQESEYNSGMEIPNLPTSGNKVALTYNPTDGKFSWE